MKVVIDTSILLVILSERSKDHDIFLALLSRKFEICVTTEILFEYEEIIARKSDAETADSALEFLMTLPNMHFVQKYFSWHLISQDYDDNKFTDCAIAAGADFLVSEDKHFNALQQIDFPKINVIGKAEFRRKLGLPE